MRGRTTWSQKVVHSYVRYLQVADKLTYITIVSHVIRGEAIARLMFAVVLNQISLASHPDFEFYPTIISEASWRSISRSKQIIFSSAGSICDCGKSHIHIHVRNLRQTI